MEVWKEVEGYRNYFVSNTGKAKRLDRILLQHTEKKGYTYVNLIRDDRKKGTQLLHRLVAKAFLPNPDNLPQVNHKDGDKTNNQALNLEWCTNAYNYQHAKENGLLPIRQSGENNPKSSLTNQQAREIRNIKLSKNGRGGITRSDLALKYGVSIHIIKDVRARKSYPEI